MQNLTERDQFAVHARAHLDGLSVTLHGIVERGMLSWQRQYPKRSMAFMDSMGSTMLGISAGPNHDPYEVSAMLPHTKVGHVCRELIDLLDWYNEISTELRVTIDDIVIGEPIWPIHWPRDRGHDPLVRFE